MHTNTTRTFSFSLFCFSIPQLYTNDGGRLVVCDLGEARRYADGDSKEVDPNCPYS